ncbi:hypothetical protein SNE40_007900 [Patella caerulea]|uniref:Endonuclease/exonuclease/phosphatase domain-containing protein n=1 Tax=Patella caerulea TaxID=87958 RepID=A0AAN8JUM4_PATCE
MFEQIEEIYLRLITPNTVFCLIGDLNARTSDLKDYINPVAEYNDRNVAYEEFSTVFEESETSVAYYGIPLQRQNQDNTLNKYGERLLELCCNLNIHIANGRFGLESGYTTCDVRSTVDYVLCSTEIFSEFNNFTVTDFDPLLSDKHCPVQWSLKCVNRTETQTTDDDGDGKNLFRLKTKWCVTKREAFLNSIDLNELNRISALLQNEDLSIWNQESIDLIVNSIQKTFQDSALSCGISKSYRPNSDKSNCKRQLSNKPWFNNTCESKRKIFFQAKNKFKRSKSDEDRQKLQNASSSYKRQLKAEYTNYYRGLNKTLKNLKRNNSKEYWRILKGPNERRNTNLSVGDFYKYFKNMNSGDPIPSNVEKNLLTSDNVNHELDAAFNESEINKCIDNLKTNKACGVNNELNEYIKCTKGFIIRIYANLFNVILNSGLIPTPWVMGMITPIYKNKGCTNDARNYRGITILSCMGKLFTAVINESLCKYHDR